MANPDHNPVSFGAFAHSMLHSNPNEVNIYYDHDGQEVDLSNTFAGNDQNEAGSSNDNETLIDSDDDSDYQDEVSEQQDPAQDLVDHTLVTLENLTLLAQPVLNEQPLRTQTLLAQEATNIFKSYAEHGSQARLSAGILKFLQGGDSVRNKGVAAKDPKRDRRLKIAPIVPLRRGSESYGEDDDAHHTLRLPKTRGGKSMVSNNNEQVNGRGEVQSTAETCSSTVVDGRTVQANAGQHQRGNSSARPKQRSVSDESWNSESTLVSQIAQADNAVVLNTNTSITHEVPTNVHRPLNLDSSTTSRQLPRAFKYDPVTNIRWPLNLDACTHPRQLPTAIKYNHVKYHDKILASLKVCAAHKALEFQPLRTYQIPAIPFCPSTTRQAPSTAEQKQTYSLPSLYSLTTDHETNALLRETPFAPLGLNFSISSQPYLDPTTNTHKKIQFPPGFIDALNRIYKLSNAHAQFLLTYFTHRYAPGPTLGVAEVDELGRKVEPPHALFRLAITQYLQSRVEGIVRTAEDDEYGLGPAERDFLRGVFEKVGVTEACVRAVKGIWPGTVRPRRDGDGNDDDDDDNDDDYDAMSLDLDEGLSDEEYVSATGMEDLSIGGNGQAGNGDGNQTTQNAVGKGEVLNHFPNPPVPEPPSQKPSTIAEDLMAGRAYVDAGLNVVEKAILAKAVDTDVETIEKFWEDMRNKRRAWGALRSWCKMMDRRRVSIAKANGTW